MPPQDAIAPYNFVPMPEVVNPSETPVPGAREWDADADRFVTPLPADRYYRGRFTGWFDLRLTARTPLYIRAPRSAREKGGEAPVDFFHRGDAAKTPVVPGSSVRGMIRSVFEVLTYSRMEFVSDRRLFYRSFADAVGNVRRTYLENFDVRSVRGGVLNRDEEGRLWIHVSTRYLAGFVLIRVTDRNIDRAWKVETERNRVYDVRVGAETGRHKVLESGTAELTRDGEHGDAGYLIIPGRDVGNNRSWFQVILKPGKDPDEYERYPVPNDVYEDYLKWGETAHGSRFGSPRAPRRLKEDMPVFALVEGDTVRVIGANLMMPMRYSHSVRDVAERSYRRRLPRFDMARAVFGHVPNALTRAAEDAALAEREIAEREVECTTLRGRVFFEDAVCCDTPDPWLAGSGGVRYPDILSGPKPTAFQTYLEQSGSELVNWENRNARVRGFKRYWHRSPEAAQDALHEARPVDRNETQDTRIRPVRPESVFTGRVRFENLTAVELGALYAAIQLPRGLAHKLGMAKNLGLGSVDVKVVETVLWDDMAARYASFAPEDGRITGDAAVEKLRAAYSAFVHRIAPERGTLWNTPRMDALAALLSVEPLLPDASSRQIPISTDRDNQWRRRNRLPTPQAFPQFDVDTDDVFEVEPLKEEEAEAEAPPAHRAYRLWERVTVMVRKKTSFGIADVELPDGVLVKRASVGNAQEGQTVTLKVTQVNAEGRIRDGGLTR